MQKFTEKQPECGNLNKSLLCRLDRAQLRFQPVKCDLCGSQNASRVQSVFFLDNEFHFVRCRECGLIYQNPRLTKDSLNRIYESLEYWEHNQTADADGVMLNYYSYSQGRECRTRNAQSRVKWISRYLPKGSRILDLGCSDGLVVDALSRHGYQASGIDISSSMITHAKRTYGADVRVADFSENWPFEEKFDGISCFATLSNFFDPSSVFKNISWHIRPGGYFFFNIGDGDRFFSKMLGKIFIFTGRLWGQFIR